MPQSSSNGGDAAAPRHRLAGDPVGNVPADCITYLHSDCGEGNKSPRDTASVDEKGEEGVKAQAGEAPVSSGTKRGHSGERNARGARRRAMLQEKHGLMAPTFVMIGTLT